MSIGNRRIVFEVTAIIIAIPAAVAAFIEIYRDRELIPQMVCAITGFNDEISYCREFEVKRNVITVIPKDPKEARLGTNGKERAISPKAVSKKSEHEEPKQPIYRGYSTRQQPDSYCDGQLVRRSFQKPSIDCKHTNEPIEDLICADAELSAADNVMAQAYKNLLRRSRDRKSVRQSQRDFLNRRLAECGLPRAGIRKICDLAASKSCVLRLTTERTTFLQNN